MPTRRRTLAALLAALVTPHLPAAPRNVAEGFVIVDGWILTEADLRALGRA